MGCGCKRSHARPCIIPFLPFTSLPRCRGWRMSLGSLILLGNSNVKGLSLPAMEQLALLSVPSEHVATALHWRLSPGVTSWSASITQSYNFIRIRSQNFSRFLPRFTTITKKLWLMSSLQKIYNGSTHDTLKVLSSADVHLLHSCLWTSISVTADIHYAMGGI